MSSTIPPLQLTGGHAGPSDGTATGSAVSGTGDLVFKGSSTKDNSTGWLQSLAPVAVAGVALWAGRAPLALVGAPFDARARADLSRIASDTAADMAAYEAMTDQGKALCLGVVVDGERRGTVILSQLREGGELVAVANAVAVEPVKGRNMTAELCELLEAWARAQGAAKMRFWTARAGLAARAAHLGYETRFVMEKDT